MILISLLIFIIPALFFTYWVYQHPTSLWTGFWFLILLASFFISLILAIESFYQPLAIMLGVLLGLLVLIFGIFGVYATIIALFWNERILLKKEKKTLANFLPLIIATGLIGLEGTLLIVNQTVTNESILKLFSFINLSFLYFSMLFILYALTALIYTNTPIHSKVDYIIILGAGLNGDRVTPLLARRIDAGIALYKQQIKIGGQPTIILSGGQGSDELISEAKGMANYLKEQKISIPNLYLEEQSTTTRENLLFSQKVAQQQDDIRDFSMKKVVVASNNYHILRAGKIAHSLGLNIRGVGAKTASYYLPTAFIREYIGYLIMTKHLHLIVIGLFGILTGIPLILGLFI